VSPFPAELDGHRRQALEELIAVVSGVVAQAEVVTRAALRFDAAGLGEATARLAAMGADPVLNLGRVNEIYGALRGAIVDRQPSRLVPLPSGDTPSAALTDSRDALAQMMLTRFRAARFPEPGGGHRR
jgi:hypothetical protein